MIVGTGVSGVILLMPVSIKSKIPCCVVRKNSDVVNSSVDGGSHSNSSVELDLIYDKIKRYVIIDDVIESGKTVHRIIDKMGQTWKDSECAGIVLYQDYCREDYEGYLVSCVTSSIREIETMKMVSC